MLVVIADSSGPAVMNQFITAFVEPSGPGVDFLGPQVQETPEDLGRVLLGIEGFLVDDGQFGQLQGPAAAHLHVKAYGTFDGHQG